MDVKNHLFQMKWHIMTKGMEYKMDLDATPNTQSNSQFKKLPKLKIANKSCKIRNLYCLAGPEES